MKRKIYQIIGFFIINLFLFTGCNQTKNANENSLKVEVYTISPSKDVYLDGQIEYIQQQSFTQDTTKGTIDKINVENNEQVKKGQALFSYKNTQAIEGYNNYTQQLQTLKSQYNQLKQQKDNGVTTVNSNSTQQSIQSQIDENTQQQENLKQQINDTKDSRYTIITAPFDGSVVLSSDINKNILTLTNPTLHVVANVSEKDVLKIKENENIKITAYGTTQEIDGTISHIENQPLENSVNVNSSATSTTSISNVSYYPVYININQQSSLYPGFHVQGIADNVGDLPKIPIESTFSENDKIYVWLISDEKLKKVEVTLEKLNDSYMQVTNGLSFGDQIISKPTSEMKEGEAVNVSTSKN